MQELAVMLLPDADHETIGKFPTGALATLNLSGSWSSLAAARAELVTFLRPRELD
jgi:phosphohistidine phosphatase SixA